MISIMMETKKPFSRYLKERKLPLEALESSTADIRCPAGEAICSTVWGSAAHFDLLSLDFLLHSLGFSDSDLLFEMGSFPSRCPSCTIWGAPSDRPGGSHSGQTRCPVLVTLSSFIWDLLSYCGQNMPDGLCKNTVLSLLPLFRSLRVIRPQSSAP